VLTPYSLPNLGDVHHVLIESFTERIATAGYRLELELHPGLFDRYRSAQLQRLSALPDTAAWLLFFSTEPMQRWFAGSGRPAWSSGVSTPACNFPASTRTPKLPHAMPGGLFCARGHRELVYLRADFTSLGDRLCSEAFVAEARRLGANARIVIHVPDVPGVCRALDGLFATRPRPSGFFIAAAHSLTALCYLLDKGIRIPGEAALVCG
jgi:hypothetical protein